MMGDSTKENYAIWVIGTIPTKYFPWANLPPFYSCILVYLSCLFILYNIISLLVFSTIACFLSDAWVTTCPKPHITSA